MMPFEIEIESNSKTDSIPNKIFEDNKHSSKVILKVNGELDKSMLN